MAGERRGHLAGPASIVLDGGLAGAEGRRVKGVAVETRSGLQEQVYTRLIRAFRDASRWPSRVKERKSNGYMDTYLCHNYALSFFHERWVDWGGKCWIKRNVAAAAEGSAIVAGFFTLIDCCRGEGETPHVCGSRWKPRSKPERVTEEVVVAAVDGEQWLFVQ